MKYTSIIRSHLGHTAGRFPVQVMSGNSPAVVSGEYGHWTTRGGTPVHYPQAYARKGWSNLVYHGSTIHATVGINWLEKNLPEAYAAFMRERRNKHIRVYVYDPNPLDRTRHIEVLPEMSNEVQSS